MKVLKYVTLVVSVSVQLCCVCGYSKCACLNQPLKTIVQFIKFIIYRIFNGRQPSLVIHDPELLKCVFVKNNKDFPNRRVRFLLCVDSVMSIWSETVNVKFGTVLYMYLNLLN